MNWLRMTEWSPYVVGAGIGMLNMLAFLLSNKSLGCSTAFSQTSCMLENMLTGGCASRKTYYQKLQPLIDWQWMLVIGIFIGAFISAKLSGTFSIHFLPQLWKENFGDTTLLRLATAIIGGILLGYGARWAGGCTSGHGISGTAQLALSSWISVMCFFIGGVCTAMLMYNVFWS